MFAGFWHSRLVGGALVVGAASAWFLLLAMDLVAPWPWCWVEGIPSLHPWMGSRPSRSSLGSANLARANARSSLASCGSLALTVPSWWFIFTVLAVTLPWWVPFGSSSAAAPLPWHSPFSGSLAKVSSWRLFGRRSSFGALRPLRLPFGSPCSFVVSVSWWWAGLLGLFRIWPHGGGASSSGVLVMVWVFLLGSFSLVSPQPWWLPSGGSSALDLPLVVSAACIASSRQGVILLVEEWTSLLASWAPWWRVGILDILLAGFSPGDTV